jgi:hypothetical protein
MTSSHGTSYAIEPAYAAVLVDGEFRIHASNCRDLGRDVDRGAHDRALVVTGDTRQSIAEYLNDDFINEGSMAREDAQDYVRFLDCTGLPADPPRPTTEPPATTQAAIGIMDILAAALSSRLPDHQSWTVTPLRLDTSTRPGALERYALDKTAARPDDDGPAAAEMSDVLVDTILWGLNSHYTAPGGTWYTDGVQAGTSPGTIARIEFYRLPAATVRTTGLLG